MEGLKSNEKLIQEYKTFIVVEITCKNGNKYRETRPNPKHEEKIKSINKVFDDKMKEEAARVGKKYLKKTGYHKSIKETHPKRKRYKNENKYSKINNKRNRKNRKH